MKFEEIILEETGSPAFSGFFIDDTNSVSGARKRRYIEQPNQAMRAVHGRLIDYIRSLKVPMPYAYGSLPGSSTLRNIRKHWQNRYYYLLDLQAAYQGVDSQKLARVLCGVDSRLSDREEEVLAFLERFCLSSRGGLVVGAPASPDLFNLYVAVLIDRAMGQLCDRYEVTYTRYLDDLTFSSLEVIGERKRREIRKIISAAGFTLSYRKAQVLDRHKGDVFINGIGITVAGRLIIPGHYRRRVRGLIHLAQRDPSIPIARINGMAGIIRTVNPNGPWTDGEWNLLKGHADLRTISRR